MSISLKINGVSKSFRGKAVLKDTHLEAHANDIIGLIGKSGCGKSTLLKILVGYHKPDRGTIQLNNRNISSDIKGLRRIVGFTTQENSFYDKLTVWENMEYYANLYRIKNKSARINDLLTKVGLIDHRKTLSENLSGGMKRRLDFAISLLHNPSVLILDEPTAGLDPLLIEQFWKVVYEVVAEEHKIVIMTSHILSEIEMYCNKVAVMDQGRIIRLLKNDDLKNLEKKFKEILGDKK